MVKSLVDEILSYVSVNKRTRNYIYGSLVPTLERNNITNLKSVYRLLTNLIDESGDYHFKERSHVRLDWPRYNGDKRINLTKYPDQSVEDSLALLLSRENEQIPDSPGTITYDGLRDFFSSRLPQEQFRLIDYLLSAVKNGANERYDRKILERHPQIKEKLDVLANRLKFIDGVLIVPKRFNVNFDSGILENAYGYSSGVVMKVYEMLLKGIGVSNIRRLTGLSKTTIKRWRKDFSLPPTKMSKIYPIITISTETRIKEAAEKGVGLEQTALYAETSTNHVKAVWRKLGYDWISREPEKEVEILGYIGNGKRKPEIRKLAGISEKDMKYFLIHRQNATRRFLHSGRQKSLEVRFPEKYEKILKGYAEDMGYSEIAEYAGVNKLTVWRKLKKLGLKKNRPRPAQKSLVEIVKSAEQPVTPSEVHRALYGHVSLDALTHTLGRAAKNGLIERKKIRKRWHYIAPVVNGSQPYEKLAEVLPVIEAKVKERAIYLGDYSLIKDIYSLLARNIYDPESEKQLLNFRNALKGIIKSDGMYRESPESTSTLTKAVSILEGILSENSG